MGFVDDGQGGLRATADDGHARSPGANRRTCAPVLTTSPANSMPGMSGVSRGCRVVALSLHDVGAIESGGVDRYQQLGVARGGIGPILKVEFLVSNDHGTHEVHSCTLGRAESGFGPVTSTHGSLRHPSSHAPSEDTSLGAFAGKTLLVVNVASKCGLTPQYEGLERLQKTYGDRGFSVVGFPCNQFLGKSRARLRRCPVLLATYGVSFPLMEKIDVNGDNRNPIYEELTAFPDAEGRRGILRGTSRSSSSRARARSWGVSVLRSSRKIRPSSMRSRLSCRLEHGSGVCRVHLRHGWVADRLRNFVAMKPRSKSWALRRSSGRGGVPRHQRHVRR